MSILSTVKKPNDRPVFVTIFGDPGLGKTTLACSFPNPIVIRAEDGLQAIPADHRPDAFPMITEVGDLWMQLKGLLTEEHSYKTLIIDSVSALERLFIQDVVDSDPKKPRGIQQALGGYGSGRDAVTAMHARVRKAAGLLSERKGMHIVFLAHVENEQIVPPDDETYTRYNLGMHAKGRAAYVDDVDLVGFLKLETFTTGTGERKKAISDGTRVLITHAMASCVSKTRYGITEPLTVLPNVNPLVEFVPALAVTKKEKVK